MLCNIVPNHCPWLPHLLYGGGGVSDESYINRTFKLKHILYFIFPMLNISSENQSIRQLDQYA